MGFQSIFQVWKVIQIGSGGGGFRCARSCLFSSRPSNVIEGVAALASTRETGIGQIVIFKARLAWYLAIVSAHSFQAIPA
eukprot:1145055-Pelagomonas_calceolata.AAC.2